MMRRIAISVGILIFFLSACNQTTIMPTTTIAPTGMLTPYKTATTIPTVSTATIIPVIPVTPAPTATPFFHTISNDDTMLGIAYQYGISLEELQAANTGVDPHFLSVGKQLIIPISGEIPEVLPTPTSMPVRLDQPKCYRSGDGGAWCILAIHNELEINVENISAWVGLINPDGENIASQVAYTPLNLVKSGQTVPILAYFGSPLPEKYAVVAEIISGLPVARDDPRYVDVELSDEKEDISSDGSQAKVIGTVTLPVGDSIPSQVWVLAVAYDGIGNIVGVRKWESSGELGFNLTVYSIGGVIDHVEVLVEAKP